MDYIRIGDKIVSLSKITSVINEIMEYRCKGYSQQETARILDVDRTFISRLESIGEVRKGGNIAVIGFPVKNKAELYKRLRDEGIEYILLMTEDERNNFIKDKGGEELVNDIFKITSEVRKYQHCIIIGSRMRTKLLADLLDSHVYTINIGESPLKNDVYVDPEEVIEIIKTINA